MSNKMVKKTALAAVILSVILIAFAPVSAVTKTYTENIDIIRANITKSVTIHEPDLNIDKIEFISNKTIIEDCTLDCHNRLTISMIDYAPSPVLPSKYRVFQYYRISVPAEIGWSIVSVSITFHIGKNLLYKFDKSDIALMRLDNEWEELDTELVSEAPEVINYRAKTPNFSFFAIVGEKSIGEGVIAEEETAPKLLEEVAPIEEEALTVGEIEEAITDGKDMESANLNTYLLSTIAILLIIILGYLVFSRKRKS